MSVCIINFKRARSLCVCNAHIKHVILTLARSDRLNAHLRLI